MFCHCRRIAGGAILAPLQELSPGGAAATPDTTIRNRDHHDDTETDRRAGLLLPLSALQAAEPDAATTTLKASFDRLQQSRAAAAAQSAPHQLLLDIAALPETQRLVAVGEQGVILYSDDGGDSWLRARTPVRVLLTAVSFPSARLGWAVGHDGVILHSEDGGASWQTQASGTELTRLQLEGVQQAITAPYPAEEADLHAALLDEWRYQRDGFAEALEQQAMPTLLDVQFLDIRHGFALGAYGALFVTDDGGQHWRSIGHRLPNPDQLHLNALLASRSGRLLIAGEAGLLLASDDQGRHWRALESPYQGSFFALAEADRLYLLGLRGHLFGSADGERWQPLPLDTAATLNGALSSAGRLYLLGQGGALLQQQGERFQPLPLPQRRSFSAGLALDAQRLLLVGEQGISHINLAGVTP